MATLGGPTMHRGLLALRRGSPAWLGETRNLRRRRCARNYRRPHQPIPSLGDSILHSRRPRFTDLRDRREACFIEARDLGSLMSEWILGISPDVPVDRPRPFSSRSGRWLSPVVCRCLGRHALVFRPSSAADGGVEASEFTRYTAETDTVESATTVMTMRSARDPPADLAVAGFSEGAGTGRRCSVVWARARRWDFPREEREGAS